MNKFSNINAQFKLIFYHNAPVGGPFNQGEELFFRSNDGSKYSSLGILSDYYKKDGYFEFFLKYEYEQLSPVYVHWKQSSNPIKTKSTQTEIGFQPIYQVNEDNVFKGLSLSSQYSDSCFLDGTPGVSSDSSWWYSIAAFRMYPTDKTVPGRAYLTTQEHQIGAIKVYLWVRMPFSVIIVSSPISSFSGIALLLSYILIIIS